MNVAGIVYMNFCAENVLEVPGSKGSKLPKVIENDKANVIGALGEMTHKLGE